MKRLVVCVALTSVLMTVSISEPAYGQANTDEQAKTSDLTAEEKSKQRLEFLN